MKKKVLWTIASLVLCMTSVCAQRPGSGESAAKEWLSWSELPELPPASGQSEPLGVAGPFAGVHNDALIVAGGANFSKPVWESGKVWHKDIAVLTKAGENAKTTYTWTQGFALDRPLAYGAAVSAKAGGNEIGVVCMGGNDAERAYAGVFVLTWDAESKQIEKRGWPSLPSPCANGSAAQVGDTIYLAGGCSGLGLETAMQNVWALDLSKRPDYAAMSAEDLKALAERRAVALTPEETGALGSRDANKAAEARKGLVEKLLASDAAAAAWGDASLEELMEEAKKGSVAPTSVEATERQDLAKALVSGERQALLHALERFHWGDFVWKPVLPWPGPTRAFNLTVAQHNGIADCLYIISGRRNTPDGASVMFLTDVYEFNPSAYDASAFDPTTLAYSGSGRQANPWRKRADVPRCVCAGLGIGVGQSHIFVLGGADGSLFFKSDELKDDHPGFPKEALAYHTITNTWVSAGAMPAAHVTTIPVQWGDSIIIPSGEVRPRVRSPKIWQATPVSTSRAFGAINFAVLVLYLSAMIGVGVFFAFRNKNTEDFFRGGQRVPWFVAGLSIFATMLSSITFVAIPAKAFATDWVFFVLNLTILLVSPLVVFFFLPFFRRIDATSAYEYLEKRFNVAVRLFGSASFVLFQIGRMAIVMYLPALALAAITPMSNIECILLMGILSVVYCTMGGLEAVVWTDTIQTFVLLGGALLSFGVLVGSLDGGFGEFTATALADDKFRTVNWDWDALSYSTAALWVIVLGGIGQNLVPYASDQAVVQRYMAVRDQRRAAKAIWMNAATVIPAGLLFFGLGTALYVFYKSHPALLDPTFKTDAIFPLFIARQLPAGVAGLVVAGIFAAAQSTISTSMNSTSTAIVTDFVRRFGLIESERNYLMLARVLTFTLGCLGTALAVLFAVSDIRTIWDQFMALLGLFGGAMCGLFCLGIFTTRATGAGALIGAVASACCLSAIQAHTKVSFLLYATIGIAICFAVGYVASLLMPRGRKDIEGLTIYSIHKNDELTPQP